MRAAAFVLIRSILVAWDETSRVEELMSMVPPVGERTKFEAAPKVKSPAEVSMVEACLN